MQEQSPDVAGRQPISELVMQDGSRIPVDQTSKADYMKLAADQPLTGSPVDAAAAGNLMSINDCPACGARHQDLTIREYAKPTGAGTHWYLCPTLGDPCAVTLAGLKSGEGLELDGGVCQALADAQMAGQWLVAVFKVKPDGNVGLRRIPRKFPHAHFDTAWKLLRQNLQGELERVLGPQQPEVMAEAPRPEPLRSLYGDGNTPLS